MRRQRSGILLVGLVVAAFGQLAHGPTARPAPLIEPAQARAWVIRVATSNEDLAQLVQVAEVAAEGGTSPWASGAPIAFGGEAPVRAFASPEQRKSVETPWSWNDTTGSGAVEMTATEAHVAGSSARARTAASTVSGSGFSVANMLLTWEQQEELIGTWSDANAQIFAALNEQMKALEPALAPLGLVPPQLEPMAGLGWIDVINAQEVSADVDTSSSEFFSSSRARSYAGGVKLFGGFISVYGVRADAVSESAEGVDERSAVASIDHLEIAGIRVEASSDGLEVAGNDLTKPLGVNQDDLDGVLGALAEAGLTIRVNQSAAQGDRRQATALEIRAVTPEGIILASIGHAEAEAPRVKGVSGDALPPSAPVTTTPTPKPTSTPTSTAAVAEIADVSTERSSPPSPPQSTAPWEGGPDEVAGPADQVATGPLARTLPQPAVRSVRTAYLLLVAAGVLGALMLPLVAGSTGWRRSNPSLVRRVERTLS